MQLLNNMTSIEAIICALIVMYFNVIALSLGLLLGLIVTITLKLQILLLVSGRRSCFCRGINEVQESIHESSGFSVLDASLCPTVEKNVLSVLAMSVGFVI